MKYCNLFFALLFFAFQGISQTPILVQDFYAGAQNGYDFYDPSHVQTDHGIYFAAYTASNKAELFVMRNGVISSLKQICNNCNSYSGPIEYHNGNVYFMVKSENSVELWAVDQMDEPYLIGEIEYDISCLTLGGNNKLYVSTWKDLFLVNDKTLVKLNTNDLNFTSFESNDTKPFAPFRNGLAFFTQFGGNKVTLHYAEDNINTLAELTVGFDVFGKVNCLQPLGDGLIFAVNKEKVRFFDGNTNEINETSLSTPYAIYAFGDAVLHYQYGKGFTLVEGNDLVQTKVSDIYDTESSSSVKPRFVYGNKMLLFQSDYNTSKEYILSIDKSEKETTIVGNVSPYPSTFFAYNNNVFLADGVAGGFTSKMYLIKEGQTNLQSIYNFTQSSPSSDAFIPIGIENNFLYFFSDINNAVGRELYKIQVPLSTSISETPHSLPVLTVNDRTLFFTGENAGDMEVTLFAQDGKLLGTKLMDFDSQWQVEGGVQIIFANVKSQKTGAFYTKKIILK